MRGSIAFLSLLVDEGVTHLFGNPGTTELPLMAALPKFPQLQYVLAARNQRSSRSSAMGRRCTTSRRSGPRRT